MTGSTDPAYWLDISLRVGLAVLSGGIVGVNRDLHQKVIGLRTLGLVSLASCLLVLTIAEYARDHGATAGGADAAGRVVQGIVSGIGFLGAGAILRGADQVHVYGLTTAAAILVVAAMGIACAVAAWPILVVGFVATMFLLVVCGPLEHLIQRGFSRHDQRMADKAAKAEDP